ncbi:MAG: EAL domain-containing protein [Aeromonas sp.]
MPHSYRRTFTRLMQRLYRTHLHDISAIALLLLPLTLTNALSLLLGQGFSRAGFPETGQLFHQLSSLLVNFYPLALCVVISFYLSNKSVLNSGAFIIYALSLFYSLSHANGLFYAPLMLPNNTLAALIAPLVTFIYCRRFILRELAPQSLDFTSTIALHIAHFFCFSLISILLSLSSPQLLALCADLIGNYTPDPMTFSGGLIYQLTLGLLGAVGINGHNFLLSAKQNLFTNTVENLEAWRAGLAEPSIINQGFYDVFLGMGGSGNSLALLLCIFLFSRNRNHILLAMAAVPMVLFNINEVLLFGLPIIFNPILIIPFILVPLVSFVLTYGAIASDFFNPVITTVDWMTPPLISGYLAMGNNLSGSLLQVLILLASIFIYRPFYLAFAGNGLTLSENKNNIERFTLNNMLSEMKEAAHTSQRKSHAQRRVEEVMHQGELVMFYQRQTSVKQARACAFEALVRYRDTNGRLQGPAFISDFQLIGAMPVLDFKVVELVLADMQTMPLEQIDRVSINIAAVTIQSPDFIPTLQDALLRHQIAPEKLEIEITEEALLDKTEQLLQAMEELHDMGVHIALDDFGAGFASFPHLMKYPFDKVKLDRALLLDCNHDAERDKGKDLYRLLAQIGTIAHCVVVAEGVETKREFNFVKGCGIDLIQGYLLARPLPLGDVIAQLANDKAAAKNQRAKLARKPAVGPVQQQGRL